MPQNSSEPALFVAFGKVSDPRIALAQEGGEVAAQGGGLGRQVAVIGADMPAVRINAPGWLKVGPEMIAALPERADLRVLVRDRLRGLTPPFAARSGRWIEAYLDRAEAVAGKPGEGILQPSDRVFAALLPLPAAHVLPVDLGAKMQTVEGYDFVTFDLAFWDGKQLIGILFGGESSRPPAVRVALARLEALMSGRIALRWIVTPADEASLAEEMLKAMASALPPWFGPYRAEGFREPLPV